MELIERAGILASLQAHLEKVADSEGHCVLVSGEAGIGKTSLVREFCREIESSCKIYQGTCDALFTPRLLAPLYDIALQMGIDLLQNNVDSSDRAGLFTKFIQELSDQKQTSLILFEDVHWADEATLDFIKFFARRITHTRCLFILTYRDDEIHFRHPLRNVLGQLSADSFSRLHLAPLSRPAVERLAEEKGYSGEDVYSITSGNPFYVNEILANYSAGVPENIKDSVLSVFNRQEEKTKRVWEILSVIPGGFEIKYLDRMEPDYSSAVKNSLDSKILILEAGRLLFKHELYRRTIEASLSPLLRLTLNKKILDLFLGNFEQNQQIERIIHHAKNASEYDLVVRYAPLAAARAACLGAHLEASKLYFSAIEYYQGNDKDLLVQFYEWYAYECYLTNQIKEAIIFQGKALNLWKEKGNMEKISSSMRFLSRFWWFDGNRQKAESFGVQAIEVLRDQPSTSAKAMAFSNMSQLKMLSSEHGACIFWGEQAIAIAKELDDMETLSHALNNVGTSQMQMPVSKQKGIELLEQSLGIALKNSYHEHAARAYANLGTSAAEIKDVEFAKKYLDAGILYCEERDLDSWTSYMIIMKARLNLETGNWVEAYRSAEKLLRNENQLPVARIGALIVLATVKMRKGDLDVLDMLIQAKTIAFETMELQRIVPAMVALLEFEWITGKISIERATLDRTISMVEEMGDFYNYSEFAFWLWKSRRQQVIFREKYSGYVTDDHHLARKAAGLWEELGYPYQQALALFDGGEMDKRKAISIVHKLGARAIFEKMKMEMRASGIKSIPRGIRKTTQSNPALLTEREMDVLQLLREGMQNKEIAARLFISVKTVDHHISAIMFKLDSNSRIKAVQEAIHLEILK